MKFQRYFFQQYWLVFLLFFSYVCWAESSAQDLSCENATSKLNHEGRIESLPPFRASEMATAKRLQGTQKSSSALSNSTAEKAEEVLELRIDSVKRRAMESADVVGNDLLRWVLKVLNLRNKSLEALDEKLAKGAVQFRSAYNKGFFTENERYIAIIYLGRSQISIQTKSVYIKSFDGDNLVIEEVDIDGNIIERTLSDNEILRAHINPIGRQFFNSMDSQLEEVGSVQYSHFNEEAKAVQQGFSEEMFKGLDEAYRMSELASHLRESNINPYKTHIEDFSASIPEHIRHTQESIQTKEKILKNLIRFWNGTDNDLFSKVKKRLEALDRLASEALKKQQEKGVTYAWYLEWNFKLSQLASRGASDSDNVIPDEGKIIFSDIIESFPYFVAIPTIQDIGIMGFNKSISENVFPLVFSNKVVFADGREFSSGELFFHDILHSRVILQSQVRNDNFPYGKHTSLTNLEFYNRLQSADIPQTQRQQAEMFYFIHVHDKGLLYDDPVSIPIGRINVDKSLLELLPENIRGDKEKIQSYLIEVEEVYRGILHNQ